MAEERLELISLHQEMQRSYLEYAMSVIVGRALPDARDGLKPVQRRILFAMHELGLTPDRPYRKCARVVGDVLGKYHPHGDQAVYDALVRLVQNFASRYPILDGHGNFGSVDDDPPAAMRYTETRLAQIAHEAMLDEIGSETVDFLPNFDGSNQEPSVLPAQLPFLLLNGCSGIAVGMATSIPPHNLNEVVDALINLLKKPDLSDDKLLKLIPGPDFPTGGQVLLGSGVRETYLKGRGSIPMRGVGHIEETQPGKGKHRRTAVVITELPYQVSKAGWIEKLAEQVNDGKIGGVSDIRDESDRDGMRIIVELRRDADPDKLIKELHRKTQLQNNFGAILLALVNGQPKQLPLRELLNTFLEYRESTLIRRTKYHLKKTSNRLETILGLIKALKNVKIVIEMIESAKDAMEAQAKLMVHLELNESQADSVLAMPLRRLTTLEQTSLHKEVDELELRKKELELLLNSREKLLEEMSKELRALKKRYGNPRRTQLVDGGDELLAEKNASQRPNAELQRKQAFEALASDSKLLIQSDNQVKIVNPKLLGRLHLNESSAISDENIAARLILPISESPKILAISNRGRIALLRWEFAGQNPGIIERFLPTGLDKEKIINIIPLINSKKISLGLLSTDGRFKRLAINNLLDLSGRATTIVKLKNNVDLKSAVICGENQSIIIITSFGRVLKLKIEDQTLPLMGKLAQGPIIIKTLPGESIIDCISTNKSAANNLILVTKNGIIKNILIDRIRNCRRGDLGDIVITLQKKNEFDKIVGIADSSSLISILTNKQRTGRINLTELETLENENQIKELIKLKDNEVIEKVITLTSNIIKY